MWRSTTTVHLLQYDTPAANDSPSLPPTANISFVVLVHHCASHAIFHASYDDDDIAKEEKGEKRTMMRER